MRENPSISSQGRCLHRIRQVRENAGISLRAMARRMNRTTKEVRDAEQQADPSLSELFLWQNALEVPLAELLVEPDLRLSNGVGHRAALIRVAKTAHSLQREVTSEAANRLCQMLIQQLEELMPELKAIGPWHEVGTRRTDRDLGRAAERIVSSADFHTYGSEAEA